MNVKSVGIIASALLFIAMFSGLPAGYFIFLRYVVCGSALYFSWNFYQAKVSAWALIFLGIALVFNPFFPVYLTKAGWAPIDFITAILFLIPLTRKKKYG